MLFGVDYYPEQWEAERRASDLRRMREFGFKAIRMMEFAWPIVEPKPGSFDFSLFDEALALADAQGIKAVIGTPTATPPVWLAEQDTGILGVYVDGTKRDFGTRRQCCFNSPKYREASRRVTKAIAEHYGRDPRVIGFQIDNEIGHEGSDRCVCPNCVKAFPLWLKEKYGEVTAMNEAWGAIFWGTSYARFEQVPLPKPQVSAIQNPALYLDYYRFMSDSAARFASEQVEILRGAVTTGAWITTNLYPSPLSAVLDTEALVRPMDFASFDNYPSWGHDNEPIPYYFNAYQLSFMRGLKTDKAFAIMEEFSGVQGHRCLGYLPPPAQVALWTNQAIARGADTLFYFRWRTARFAQEQLCYGIYDADDEESDRSRAIKANMARVAPFFDRVASVPVQSEACVVWDRDNANLIRDQHLTEGLENKPADFMHIGYDTEAARHFAPLALFNVNADVRSAASIEMGKYKLVSLPLYQMVESAFASRLEAWVEKGGTLILGWRAGTRDRKNWMTDQVLPGVFAKMAGIRARRFESLNKTKGSIRIGPLNLPCENWADIIEPTSAKALARYATKGKHYAGEACVTVNRFGAGRVYYIGTSLGAVATFLLYGKILKAAGLGPRFLGMGVEMVTRSDSSGAKYRVVMNHNPKAKRAFGRRIPAWGTIALDERGHDVLA